MSDWILIPVKIVTRNPGPSIGGLIFLIILLSIKCNCPQINQHREKAWCLIPKPSCVRHHRTTPYIL